MKNLPISVQICTLNEAENIEDTIKYCHNNFPPADEIIIIDGGSSDTTIDIVLGCKVRLIKAGRVGLAAQRQIGIENTQLPYVLILDADDRPEKDYFKKLYDQLLGNSFDAICGLSRPFEQKSYWQKGWNNSMTNSIESAIITSTNMIGRPALYKRDILLKVGFDPYFNYGSEDTDLSYAFELRGKKQGQGTAVCQRIHEKKFKNSVNKWIAYGKGYARFSKKYPEKNRKMIFHILINLLLIRPIKKFPGSILYIPFYFLYSFFTFIGFILEKTRHLLK
jgi:succinoglycan biosynthesis protein ExoA